MAMFGEEAVAMYEPFGDEMEVEISYTPGYSGVMLAMKLPSGLRERCENDNVNERDIAYFMWIVNEHTNHDFEELVYSDSFPNSRVVYIIEMVIREITDNYELESWEERHGENPSFIDSGTLGVSR